MECLLHKKVELLGRKEKIAKGNGGAGKDGAGTKKEGMLGELSELIEEMKTLETSLSQAKKEDIEKIKQSQKKIEEKLLKFDKGLKKETGKKDLEEKREAEKGKDHHRGHHVKIADKYKYLLKRFHRLQKKKIYPPAYQKRIEYFIRQLEQSQ